MAKTFGYTSILGASVTPQNKINGVKANCPEAGTGDSITVYLDGWAADEKVKCCLYDASQNKVTNGETEERTTGGAAGWYTFNFLSPPDLVNADYWIVAMADSEMYMKYSWESDPGWTMKYQCARTYGDGFPASVSGCGDDHADSAFSIYCTYTPGAPPGVKTLVQATLISIPPLIVLPTLREILRFTG